METNGPKLAHFDGEILPIIIPMHHIFGTPKFYKNMVYVGWVPILFIDLFWIFTKVNLFLEEKKRILST